MTTWVRTSDGVPADNREVLVFGKNERGYGRILRAQWSDGHSLESNGESDDDWYNEEDDRYYCPQGWYETNEYEETHWRIEFPVTHWMPLPDPPKEDPR